MKIFTLIKRNEYHHYHHCRFKEWKFSILGREILAWWNSKDDDWSDGTRGSQHLRLCIGLLFSIHLFTGKCNYLEGRGWEFSIGTYRLTHWLRPILNWSFGRSSDTWDKFGTVHRWRGWAFCNHNAKPVYPELEEQEEPPMDPEEQAAMDAYYDTYLHYDPSVEEN